MSRRAESILGRATLLLLHLTLTASTADAHQTSNSYLTLIVERDRVQGQWDIAVRDLDQAIGLDQNQDGLVTWGELRAQADRVGAYAFSRLGLRLGGRDCAPKLTGFVTDYHPDGPYAVLRFVAECGGSVPEEAALTVRYALLFDVDPQHRGLAHVRFEREQQIGPSTGYDSAVSSWAELQQLAQQDLTIFRPGHPEETFTREPVAYSAEGSEFLRNGVWHIWTGYDHVLFLVSLLLPAVMRREAGSWQPVDGFREALVHTVKVVTAFTVAHSITLSAAVLRVVDLPSRLVESLIALSVAVAALNNFYPVFDQDKAWRVAFAFGLVHGFGFASVLVDLGLTSGAIAVGLVSFNLGVEIGQLAIVAALLPLAFWCRKTAWFRRLALTAGSVAISLVALGWFTERALNVAVF